MVYLNLDQDGYLLSVASTPMTGAPSIDTLEGLDLSGVRINAYRWDGGGLALDEGRLAALEAAEAEARRTEADAEARAVAMTEVQAALITAQINTLAVDDATALRWRVLYPDWAAGAAYETGVKVQRAGRLWRCVQPHTAQTGWEPETAASLWTEICESHAGTADDPIPYSGNMALESGKYYTQNGVTYRCTRDTGDPVYHPLAELVGLYVEAAGRREAA